MAERYWEGRWRDERAENERLKSKLERLERIERAARLAHDYHMRGFRARADFEANVQLDLLNALGRALEE